MATLYIVATPIGNLKDITLRALDALTGADAILCEDTRVTKKLLDRYNIQKPLISYHQHSRLKKLDYIMDLLKQGKNLALVSDAGTPGISDPGNELVRIVSIELPAVAISPIPGPTAVAAIASIAGTPMEKFCFMGFPPHKKKRKSFFASVAASKMPVIFYESPYRVIKSLHELKEAAGKRSLQIVIGRELTKQFETVYRGSLAEVLATTEKETPRGEFVILVF